MSKGYYIIPIFVPHHGCPHDCIFCNQKKITGVKSEIRGKDVEDTIDLYLNTINRQDAYVELSFFGGSFTGIPMDYQNELLAVAKKALDEGKIDNIRLSTRPDYINKTILDNLLGYDVGVIELGVQSMDEEVLKVAERGHTSEDVIAASNLIKEYGIKLGLQMMVGLPGDDLERDIYTAREIIKLRPDFVRIYPALVIRDTYMELMYRRGEYNPLSVDDAVEICKALFCEFEKEGIQIIRLGLQTTEQINLGRDVVAGPFHPAFRELVESSLLNDMAAYVIDTFFSESREIEIRISPRDISKLYADKKKYFYNKTKQYSTIKLRILQDKELPSMKLLLQDGEKTKIMSINDFINITYKAGFSSKT